MQTYWNEQNIIWFDVYVCVLTAAVMRPRLLNEEQAKDTHELLYWHIQFLKQFLGKQINKALKKVLIFFSFSFKFPHCGMYKKYLIS